MHLPKPLKSIYKKICKKKRLSTQNPDVSASKFNGIGNSKCKFNKCLVIINLNEEHRCNKSAHVLQTESSENRETCARDSSTSVSEEQIRSETHEINNKDSFEGSGLNANTCPKDINKSYDVKDGVQVSYDQQTSNVLLCCSSSSLPLVMASNQHKVIPSGAGFIGQPRKCRRVIETGSEEMEAASEEIKADSEEITIFSEVNFLNCSVGTNNILNEECDININGMNDLHDTNDLNGMMFVNMSSHINKQHNIAVVGVNDFSTPDSETYVKFTSPMSYSGTTSCPASQELGSVEEDKLRTIEIINKEMLDITSNYRTFSNNTSRAIQIMSLQTNNFSNSLETKAMIDELKFHEFSSDSRESGSSTFATNFLMGNSISESSTNGKWNVNSSEQEKNKNQSSNISSTTICIAVTEPGLILSNPFKESLTNTRRISDVSTLRPYYLLEYHYKCMEECRTECILDDNIQRIQVDGHNEIDAETGCSHSERTAVIMDDTEMITSKMDGTNWDSRHSILVISTDVPDNSSVHCLNYKKLSVLNVIFYWNHHILHNIVIVMICYIYIMVILNNYTNINSGIVDECFKSLPGWQLSGEHPKISFMKIVALSNDKSERKLVEIPLNERRVSTEQHKTKSRQVTYTVHNKKCFLSHIPHSEVSGRNASGAQINNHRQNRIVSSFSNNHKSKNQHGFKPYGFGNDRKKTASSIEKLPNQFVELSHTSMDSGIESGFDNSITFSYEHSSTIMDVMRKALPFGSMKPLLANNLRCSKIRNRFSLRSYILLCLKDPMLRWILVENESRETAKSVVREIHINGSHIDLCVLERYFNMFESQRPTMEEQMQFEWLRLASFGTYHGNGNALALARNGFYHDPSQGPNATRCIYCGATHSTWELFDNIGVEHQRMSPSCPLLNHMREEANIPIAQNVEQTMPASGITSATSSVSTVVSSTSPALAVASVAADDLPRSSVSQAKTQVLSSNNDERMPYQSMIQQPTEEPENRERATDMPSSFIQSFGFTGSRYSSIIAPGVNNVAEGARTNASAQSSATPGLANVASTLSDLRLGPRNRTADPTAGVVVTNPKHPDYCTLESRTNSYRGWPAYLDQTPRQMAEAGFFFVGVSDFTRCFACGGGLRNWEPGDDPVLEHTRWFPRCDYINKLKGERYVQAVERRHREHMAERQRRQNEIAQQRRADMHRPPDVTNTPAGTVLREMGFSEEKIRQAIEAIRQTGLSASDVTPQQALTWILEDEEGQSSSTLQQVPVIASTPTTPANEQSAVPSAPLIAASPMVQSHENKQQSSTTIGAAVSSAKKTKASTKKGDKSSATSASGISKMSSGESGKQNDQKDVSDDESKESTKRTGKRKKKKSERSASKLPDSLVSSASGGPNMVEKCLQQENERLREMQTCKICMENSVDTTLLPCGHLVTCEPCAKRLAKCPICRKVITGTVKIFMS